MTLNRRHLLGAAGASGVVAAADTARAAPLPSTLGRDGAQFGLRPNAEGDQTRALQRALDDCARSGVPLALAPGVYRSGPLMLANGAQIAGLRGSRLQFIGGGDSLLSVEGGEFVELSGVTLDGGAIALPSRRGLVHVLDCRDLRVSTCTIQKSGGTAIWMERSGGAIDSSTLTDTAVAGIISFDATGLLVAHNVIRGAGSNGIEILRTAKGDDGTLILGNRVEDIKATLGGTGQHGNAINAYRAGNVVVSGNRIRNCAYSAVRGNSADNIHITDNSVFDVREVALYAEFAFQGAVIANNSVQRAAVGVSVANFNEGGRLCTVHGNVIRDLLPKRPPETAPEDDAGIGIIVEADAAVTGNVIENAPGFGIAAGWGKYMRDIAITGNVVRNAFIGIGLQVVPGAGSAVVSGNMIAEAKRGAIVGLDHARAVTPDLLGPGAPSYRQIVLSGNAARNA